jgi:hypothetical protein
MLKAQCTPPPPPSNTFLAICVSLSLGRKNFSTQKNVGRNFKISDRGRHCNSPVINNIKHRICRCVCGLAPNPEFRYRATVAHYTVSSVSAMVGNLTEDKSVTAETWLAIGKPRYYHSLCWRVWGKPLRSAWLTGEFRIGNLLNASSHSAQCNKKKTPWPESASELYRPSDRCLSAKWLPTFEERGCHVVSVTDLYGRILGFLDRTRYFSIK